ncbi:phage terminase large subunit family protein [[Clostridium] symbiosum]|jgi:phage terminase large subunit GpA-like protein|uniref:Phage terminase GpA n=3 Tax=Lachnospirales TaxID=3085636 RepID=A0A2X2UKA4_9FIRM|nr:MULTISPECIES: phage terminase large subunit family protein [Lachnospiraceae]MDB2017042.1 phage terminase large subunit family protein [[Clostridium] symbiosum]CUO38970.1 phage terminase GpA [[Clostridium] symbiosum]SQB14877.1 phage terminase GpA [Enterocloster clostridioformis]
MEQYAKTIYRRIFSKLKPPPEMKMSDWADQYRRLSQGASAEPGRWRTEKVPHQKEIMDTIADVKVKKVVVMSSAQIGKTEGAVLNTIGYYMHYDPAPVLIMQPTIQMAEAFSKDRLSKMLQDTPVLSGLVNDKGRNTGNTILQKIFPGGHITMVGANSPSSLASRPIQILLADEVDRYPATAGKEGDPLFLASERLTTFWNSKEVYVSTPTIKDASRIEIEYQHSSQGEWNVPCPECGELQPLEWSGVVFDRDNLDSIQYACAKCGCISPEAAWKKHFKEGRYIHADPENPVKGFHLNALGSTLAQWKDIAEKFILANEEKKKGNIEPLKSWTNTKMGQTWEEEGTQVDDEELLKRRERYNCEVPPEVLYLTAGVDTQDDRFEIEVVGWGAEYESWGIQYSVLYGDTSNLQHQVWADLDAFLAQTFQKPDGTRMKIICTCVDSGGHRTNQVYKFCKARFNRRIFAIKGSNDSAAAYIQKPTKSNREQAYLFTLGVDTGKSLLLQRLQVEEEGPGYCHFPKEENKGYGESYFIGLTAEKQVLVYKKGRPFFEWRIKDAAHKRNEALDCRNYASAAIEISGVPLKKPDTPQKTTPPPKKKRGRRTNGGIL